MGSSPSKTSRAAAAVTSVQAAQAFKGASTSGSNSQATAAASSTDESAIKNAESNAAQSHALHAAAAPYEQQRSNVVNSEPAVVHASRRCAVVVSYHSDYGALAAAIGDALADSCDVAQLTEAKPRLLEERERLVSWCSVFVVIASIGYQRDVNLMEAVNYARSKQKRVLTIVGQKHFRPFGGLGAISIADGDILDGVDWSKSDRFTNLMRAITDRLASVESRPAGPRPDGSADDRTADAGGHVALNLAPSATVGIVISNHSETDSVRSLLEAETFGAPIAGILNESSSATASPALASCAVFIAILSPAYERSAACREHYELARALGKPVVPLIGAAGAYAPSGWVALAIAGKLFYKFRDRATAYENAKKRYYLDSVPMTEFKVAVNAQLVPLPDEMARERTEVAALQARLDECKAKLKHWPPKNRDNNEMAAAQSEPPRLTMSELLADKGDGLPFAHIKYEMTRMEFQTPAPLFDSRGVPIRRRFDVFISYQWDRQEFVRNVYQNMSVAFSVQAWMDVYGGMLGNTNEAMANGVECSGVFLAFLSAKYVASANCTLEIRYAIYRKKPLIFVLTEDAIPFPPWIDTLVKNNLTFTLQSIGDCGIDDSGLPRLNRICDAIRRLSAKCERPKYDEDVSEAVSALRATLEHALLDLAEQENVARWQVCTRCGAKFDNDSRSGCKKHSAYFMGGNIIAGRWVCCSERSRDGLGCQSTDHITAKRAFTLMPDYGTYHWVPA